MGIYDGNQLPESPTSVFQMIVSIYYTLFVSVLLAMGALAMLAAENKLDKELPGTIYIHLLVSKHKAVARGVLAFIPASYSLAHLYTSSLHNGSLYSASNVFYVAVFGFAAKYLGSAFKDPSKESAHMDTIKAVYECLYMLTRCLGRLSRHKPPAGAAEPIFGSMPSEQEDPGQDLRHLEKEMACPAWLSPWAHINVFLAIAAQDDSRSWVMFFKWLGHNNQQMTLSFVPGSAAVRHNPLTAAAYWHMLANHYNPQLKSSYAYWLYSQGATVRDFTGSLVMSQNIPAKLNMAGFALHELFTNARCYIGLVTKTLKDDLHAVLADGTHNFQVRCWNGSIVQVNAGSELVKCLHAVDFAGHGLEMACERYVCRKTPACAAHCLPAASVVGAIDECWTQLFGAESAKPNPGAAAGGARYSRWWEQDPGYWCGLWLAYLHMVLLGVDIRACFDTIKQECGFFYMLSPEAPPAAAAAEAPPPPLAAAAAAAAAPAGDPAAEVLATSKVQRYPSVHNMNDANLHGVAALLATLLLAHRMSTERLSVNMGVMDAAEDIHTFAMPEITQQDPDLHTMRLRLETLPAGQKKEFIGLLQSRTELVDAHSSLPAIVHGTKCMSATDWVQSLHTPLAAVVFVVAVVAITIATISCSNGVLFVACSGLSQAFAAWCLLQCLERLPVTQDECMLVRYARKLKNFAKRMWLLRYFEYVVPSIIQWFGKLVFLFVVQVFTLLWLLLLEVFNFAMPIPILTVEVPRWLLQGASNIITSWLLRRLVLKGLTGPALEDARIGLQSQDTGPSPGTAGHGLEMQLYHVKNHAQQVLGQARCGEEQAIEEAARVRDGTAPETILSQKDLARLGAAAAAASSLASTGTAAAQVELPENCQGETAMQPPPARGSQRYGSWLKDALVSMRTVKAAAGELFGGETLKGVGLASCFDPATGNRQLYRDRITWSDHALHLFISLSVVTFAVCIAVAVSFKPYYATSTGMCLGRCHDRVDCHSNLTLGLPVFDGYAVRDKQYYQPVCPGFGTVVFDESIAEFEHQCPAMVSAAAAWGPSSQRLNSTSPVWLRVAHVNISSTLVPSGTKGMNSSICYAAANITVSATGSPIGSCAMVRGTWALCRSPFSSSDVFNMTGPTDAQGVAMFVSPDLGGSRWLNCTFTVAGVTGYRLNATSKSAATAEFPAPLI